MGYATREYSLGDHKVQVQENVGIANMDWYSCGPLLNYYSYTCIIIDKPVVLLYYLIKHYSLSLDYPNCNYFILFILTV